MSRRPRGLSQEEEALWRAVAGTTAALPGRGPPETSAAPKEPASAKPSREPLAPKRRSPEPTAQLAPIERRLLTRLGRGSIAIDSRVDLHGLTQREAHLRLARFLGEAQARGDKIVLVITGKGRPGGALAAEERGVLRRGVPHWLAAPDLRPLVIGFEEAHAAHGGGGALYVRVRRRKALPS